MKKVLIASVVCVVMILSVCYAASFSDVPGHWGETYINSLADKGIINGYTDGTFKPNGTIKKGEFLKLIMTSFMPDFDWTQQNEAYTHWASIYIETAMQKGIIPVDFCDETTANDEITRGEVVNILGKCDIIIANEAQDGAEMEFYDIDDLDDETFAMLSHCVAKGYIAGYNDATFKPNKTLTRAEVATILYRYLNK